MQQIIDALSRQLTIEHAKNLKRDMQVASPQHFIGQTLQECRSNDFIMEMERALQVLRATQSAINVLRGSNYYVDQTVTAEEFEYKDGRKAQIQIKVTTDEFDFTRDVADFS